MSFLDINSSKKKYLFIISFLLGTSFSLSFEPFSIPFSALVIIGIFFSLNDYIFKNFASAGSTFFVNGILFGFGFFISSMYWVSNSILEFDDNLLYLIPIPLIILPIFLSLFIGLMQIINFYLWSRSNSRLFFFTSTWIIFELLRSNLFTGLPWNLIGYSWSWSLNYSQAVSIFGVYGLGLITVFCAGSIFLFFNNKREKKYIIIPALILIVMNISGYKRVNNYEEVYLDQTIRIIHTHYDQDKKWLKESIKDTADLGSPDLVSIFPESSLGINPDTPNNWISGFIRKNENKFFNSLKYDGYVYDKKILVPFGEYFPLSNILVKYFPNKSFVQSSLSKGKNEQEFPSNITPLICYEVIFPSFVRSGVSKETDLLVNISNDAWFGKFSGPKQHFVQAWFRSVELGIPMARSSNRGYSGLINPIGKIVYETSSDKNIYIDVEIPQKLENTFYRKYGDSLAYFLIVLFFIIGYATRESKEG